MIRTSNSAAIWPAMILLAVGGCGGESSNSSASNTSAPIASGTPPPTPTPTPSPTPTPTPSATTAATADVQRQRDLNQAMLTQHNAARAEVAVPLVTLDQALSDAALAYAKDLAASGRFEHSAGSTRSGQGENLWAGTASRFTYQQMSGAWIDEKVNFVAGRFPDISRTGRWQDVGHYTQIVWRNTTRIGCGIATGGNRDVLVCRYAPAGNVIGQLVF